MTKSDIYFFETVLTLMEDCHSKPTASFAVTFLGNGLDVFHRAEEAVGEGEVWKLFWIMAEQLAADSVNSDRIETG